MSTISILVLTAQPNVRTINIMQKVLKRRNFEANLNTKDPNTIDPEVQKLTKKLIKKYDKAWRELAKL